MTTTLEPPVAAPAVIDGMTAEDYHADKTSISSSGLRALLNPGCPAQFKYDRDHQQPPKREFDLGNAVHTAVLGEGHDIVEIDYPNYLKADARAARDEAYATGKVPLLPKEKAQVDAMEKAVREHPLAGPLFTPGTGIPERSIYWTDPETGVRCRVRPDWLKQLPGTTLCVDLKTIKDAAPDTISRAIRDHNYHQQDPLYIDGIEAAGLAPDGCRFIFVFVSKIAPYLITVRELVDQDRDIGRARNQRALRIYAECESTGIWPDWTGPVTEIPRIGMPSWDTLRQAEEYL
ncbi:PD-(D/E)XK nuclease-like domain-containing protein [Streptomyces sp. SM13]|uniref:PD-(D/E)XK nuclease-like domain-containing protein n=1 Tax=Streptomyces sp. SM13 TaxID=1983803 RepID=UPI0015E1ADC1|nr:PD-(D/E)XK nuclease-like domain-containing protein [Streptomyces sp. SM13]